MFYRVLIPIFIAFIIGTEGIFTGYYIIGLPVIRLTEILLFVFLIKYFWKDINSNEILMFFMKFLFLLIILLFLKLGVLVFFKNEMATYIFSDIFLVILYGIIVYLGYYMLNKNFKYINIIMFITFIIFLIAFFQSELTPFTHFAQNLKLVYFSQNTFLDISEKSLFSRLTGLYSYTLVLGYALLSTAIMSIYLYIKTSSKIYVYYFLFLGVVIFLTLTRSIILSWFLLSIFFIYKLMLSTDRINKILLLIVLIIFIFYSSSVYIQNERMLNRATAFTDKTTDGRIPLLVTGAYALLQNPLGMTDKEYDEVKKEMYNVYHHPDILVYPSHNALINFGIQYTIIGLVMFLYFIYKILTTYLNKIDKKFHLYIKISILAYLLNGLVHNAFIFNLDFPILMFLSILAYEYNQNNKDKESI